MVERFGSVLVTNGSGCGSPTLHLIIFNSLSVRRSRANFCSLVASLQSWCRSAGTRTAPSRWDRGRIRVAAANPAAWGDPEYRAGSAAPAHPPTAPSGPGSSHLRVSILIRHRRKTSVADPGCLSPIPDPKTATKERGDKKFDVIPFFVATNFTKFKIILFLNSNYRTFYPQKLSLSSQNMSLGSGIRDSGSGKNLFRIPDPDPQNCEKRSVSTF